MCPIKTSHVGIMNVGIMNVGILNKTPLIARQKGHYKLLPLLVSARMRISNKYLTMIIKYIFWNHIVHDKYFQNPPTLMGRNRCWYCNDDVSRVEKNICAGCKQVTLQITFSKVGFVLEHKTCTILAAERSRLMRFDNRLITDSFQEAICILKW